MRRRTRRVGQRHEGACRALADQRDRTARPRGRGRRARLRRGMRGRDHGQPRGHVLEDLQRRPVEAQLQRRVPARIERRDADVGACASAAGMRACGSAPVKCTPWHAARRGLGGRAFRPVADEHAAEPRVAGRVQPRQRRATGAPRRATRGRRRRTRTRSGAGSRVNGAGAGGVRPEAIDVGAPFDLEHRARDRPTTEGCRADGVTNSAVSRQSRSRQRRMGSTSSARSRRRFVDPAKSTIGAFTSSTAGMPSLAPPACPRRRSCSSAP